MLVNLCTIYPCHNVNGGESDVCRQVQVEIGTWEESGIYKTNIDFGDASSMP